MNKSILSELNEKHQISLNAKNFDFASGLKFAIEQMQSGFYVFLVKENGNMQAFFTNADANNEFNKRVAKLRELVNKNSDRYELDDSLDDRVIVSRTDNSIRSELSLEVLEIK